MGSREKREVCEGGRDTSFKSAGINSSVYTEKCEHLEKGGRSDDRGAPHD